MQQIVLQAFCNSHCLKTPRSSSLHTDNWYVNFKSYLFILADSLKSLTRQHLFNFDLLHVLPWETRPLKLISPKNYDSLLVNGSLICNSVVQVKHLLI